MRKGFLISIVAAGIAATSAGCGVGDGRGSAKGMLWILGCLEGKPRGTPDKPQAYDQDPTFFAGEPIEDITDGPPANRLIIRMQHNGNAVEYNDTIYFDIRDSGAIAKCLRGRTVNGVPDWDTGTGTVDPSVPASMPWCEQSADPTQLPAIHLVPFGPVAVSFSPQFSCHSNMHPPALVDINGIAQEGQILFKSFGGAVQGDQATTAPDARKQIDPAFRVNYGDSLNADFDFDVGDERVAAALRDKKVPPSTAVIGGHLMGFFEFELARGRAAQSFP